MQKSFSVYANYDSEPHCENCGEKANVYYVTIEGRICSQCRQKKKEKNLLKKLEQLKMS
jgi:hypothetical protein